MTRSTRNIIFAASGAASLAAVGLYAGTGAEAFTRYPTAELEEANADDGLSDLFDDTGLNDELGELERVESRFTFGLLPSGPGADSLSVAAIVGPALAISGLAWFLQRKSTKAPGETSPATPTDQETTK